MELSGVNISVDLVGLLIHNIYKNFWIIFIILNQLMPAIKYSEYSSRYFELKKNHLIGKAENKNKKKK